MPGTPPPSFSLQSSSFSGISEFQQGAPPPGIGFNPQFLPPNTPNEILNPPTFPISTQIDSNTIYPTIGTNMPTPTLIDSNASMNLINFESNSNIKEPFVQISSSSSSSTTNLSENAEENPATPVNLMQYIGLKGFGGVWQHCSPEGPFPQNLVRAGVDTDGSKIFAGRAFHEGDLIPAKVIPDKNLAVISYGGEEIVKDDFEVLKQGEFVWEFCTNGAVPEGAVEIGQTADGEKLFMGRAFYQGSQTPGKVQPSHGCLYIPFNGEEVPLAEYEVLCIK